MIEIYDPHEYQDRAFNFGLANPFCAYWMEMGLGKTVVSLTLADYLLDSFRSSRILIVAPLRVAKSTWPDEIKKWSHLQHLVDRTVVITGTLKERIKAVHQKAPIQIINFDVFVWLVIYVLDKTGGRWPWDTLIIDESSWVKHQDSKRWKAINHIRPALDRMLQLTGSPASQGLLNLWAQLFLMDGGQRLGNTYKAMKQRWYRPIAFNEYGPTWEIIPGAANEIHERVADIALSLRARDYLDLPEDMTIPVYFDLTPELQTQYRHLEANMWLSLGSQNITAVNGGALTQKCRQFASGFLYDEESVAHRVHDLKMKALKEVVDEAEGQPLLVGYQYTDDLKRIKAAFPHAIQLTDDPQIIKDWNAGKIPMMLAHPQSAGHGLNLQDGGHMIVLYGVDWRLELYEQMIARLSRQGQKYPVLVYLLVARRTIDELMLKRIEYHKDGQDALKRAVHWYQQQTMRMAA